VSGWLQHLAACNSFAEQSMLRQLRLGSELRRGSYLRGHCSAQTLIRPWAYPGLTALGRNDLIPSFAAKTAKFVSAGPASPICIQASMHLNIV